jgi:hypothetical protein
VRGAAGLVVLHNPARAERVDVDAVDLAAQVEAAPEVEAALQLGRGAVGAERDLEAPRHQRERRLRLVADEALEVTPERLLELGRLQIRRSSCTPPRMPSSGRHGRPLDVPATRS